MASSQKKQQTISSFFTKAATTTSSSPPSARTPLGPKTTNGAHSGDSDDDDLELPPTKRARRTESLDKSSVIALNQTKETGVSEQDPGKSPQSKVTARTSKYLFSSQDSQPNNVDALDVDSEDTPEQRRRKQKLHERFVKKLGKPDSIAEIKRRNRALLDGDNGPAEGEEEDVEDEAVVEEKPKGRKAPASVKKISSKLTPMEKQVLEIKRMHSDTLLIVEVGYKFRFFGEDARVAAKELGIVCIPGKFRYDEHPSEAHLDRFASASIPTHRLHVHLKRLVGAGHKVGVVRQLETAALKAAGDNRNAPFVRKLTNLYTKGTYVDDIEGIEEPEAGHAPAGGTPATGFLLCITESNAKGWGNDEKVHIGLVAVQPATGDIIYDEFEDAFMRSELETRLLHLAPCEFLIVGELSKATEKLVFHLSGTKTTVFGDKIRVERVAKEKTMAAQAFSHISSFYADKLKTTTQSTSNDASNLLDKVLHLPEHVTICLSAMISHMEEYGLEHVFDLTKYFQSFSARSHMLLNGNTLNSLEIYQNQTDHTVKGSLLWALDRTQTRFGQRLLRRWVGRPLLDREKLEERLAAVEEVLEPGRTVAVEKLKHLLSRLRTDLEKSLIRIYYGKCSRPELLTVLQSLQLIANEYSVVKAAADTGFSSSLISSAIMSLPSIFSSVLSYLGRINSAAAKSDDKYSFFLEEHETEDITEHKLGIASVEHELSEFRTTAATKLGKKSPVNYATVAGIDYLIEVENSSPYIKRVPASWTKISGTKKVSRFHPPEIVAFLRERDQHKESLAAACDVAFNALLSDISAEYQSFRDCITSLATLDCILSLAAIAQQPGYTKPAFTAGTSISLSGARHPMVEQLLLDAYVPNDVKLSNDPNSSSTSSLLITGPNMGGKSSYVRSIALISIMAQIGSYVPCESASLGLLDAVYTRMGAFDNMMKGESTFMVELSETADILKSASNRSLVILDELGRGTSTNDGVAIAGSVLDYLVREKKCLTLFITHYQNLSALTKGFPNGELKNVHMKFEEEPPTKEGEMGEITFLYEVGDGVAHRSYGLNVARLAGLPDAVIKKAAQKSGELEHTMRQRMIRGLFRGIAGVAVNKDNQPDHQEHQERTLDSLIEALEQL